MHPKGKNLPVDCSINLTLVHLKEPWAYVYQHTYSEVYKENKFFAREENNWNPVSRTITVYC